MSVIRTENLGKTYRKGAVALQGLELAVKEGEVFGFLGPNGAGKSTTIRLLLDFIRPTDGAAWLFGVPATTAEARRRVGYLPETVNLHRFYTGRRLLEFHAALSGIERGERAREAKRLLEYVGLADAASKRISAYSKGMQQRLGLAQALVGDPDLLILDEPTSNLDPVGRRDFREIVLACRRRGQTVFICSHVLSEVESVCDRVGILKAGTLRIVGTIDELSGSRGSRLFVRDLQGAAVEALSGIGVRLELQGGEAVVHCDDDAQRTHAEYALRSLGIAVDRTEAEKQSLEDIFFETLNRQEGA